MSDIEEGELHRLGLLVNIFDGRRAKVREKVLGTGALRFNELTDRVELGGKPYSLENEDIFGVRVRLISELNKQMNLKLNFGREDIRDAILWVAKQDSYHPFGEWVADLPKWDTVDRLTGDLPKAFRQAAGAIEATFLRLTVRIAVARATQPGVKADTMLVLVGKQGIYKSTAIAALGGEWFTDTAVDVDNKDSWELIHRHWFVEWGELTGLQRRDMESIKAFLSKRDDTFRAAYARSALTKLRRCVFVGTTNDEDFLSDLTGNRRFWPVRVEGKIDVEWIRANREQVFAQALHEVMGGAPLYLDEEQAKAQAATAESYVEGHAWEVLVSDWMDAHAPIGDEGCSILQIAKDALSVEPEKLAMREKKLLASILRRLGARKVRSAKNIRWYWGKNVQLEIE